MDGFNLANGVSASLVLTGTVDVGEEGNTIQNLTTAAEGDQPDPTTDGDDLEETITVNIPPVAVNDQDLDNIVGTAVPVDVLANDSDSDGTLDPATVQIVGTASPGDPLVVPGEGTWSVNITNGQITFTPEGGFTGDPTIISYNVKDNDG